MNDMGVVISFSGIDGAGKSTQVALLKKHFKSQKKSFYITEEMFGYYFMKPFIKYFRTATKSPKGGPVTRNENPFLKIWCVIAYIDIWVGYLFYFRKLRVKYDYVVADRFYYDIWANLIYYGYAPSWSMSVVSLLPRSDIPLRMKVNPKKVLSREDDFPAAYYVEQDKIYDSLAQYVTFIKIDANKTPNQVFSSIKRHL